MDVEEVVATLGNASIADKDFDSSQGAHISSEPSESRGDISTNMVSASKLKEANEVDRDAITKRNAMESPLLRLPAELRLRIWKYAAGNSLFSLFYKCREYWGVPGHDRPGWWDLRGLICTHNVCANPSKVKYERDIEFESINGEMHDTKKYRQPRIAPIFTCGIAGVCRQIRAETLNLQYQTQVFDCDDVHFFKWYSYVLSPAQRSAVRLIQLSSNFFPTIKSGPPYGEVIGTFPNVKRIYHSECREAYPSDDENDIAKRIKHYDAPANVELIMMGTTHGDLHKAQIYMV